MDTLSTTTMTCGDCHVTTRKGALQCFGCGAPFVYQPWPKGDEDETVAVAPAAVQATEMVNKRHDIGAKPRKIYKKTRVDGVISHYHKEKRRVAVWQGKWDRFDVSQANFYARQGRSRDFCSN
jgi:hypothetical protein